MRERIFFISSPSTYHQISLTSVPRKIPAKMISKRLTWYIDKNYSLSNFLSGYRKKDSQLTTYSTSKMKFQKLFKVS